MTRKRTNPPTLENGTRSRAVLQALADLDGTPVTGQELAEMLGYEPNRCTSVLSDLHRAEWVERRYVITAGNRRLYHRITPLGRQALLVPPGPSIGEWH